jgi:hypothetical protein
MREVAGIGKLRRHVAGLLGHLERNRAALVHYAARRRRGETSCVNPLPLPGRGRVWQRRA